MRFLEKARRRAETLFSRLSHSEILRPATEVFAARLIGAAASGALVVALARLLGPSGSGLYYLAVSAGSVGAIIGKLGMDNAAMRFASTSFAAGRLAELKAVYRASVLLSGAASVLAGVGLWAFASILARSIFDEPLAVESIRIAAVLVPALTLLQVHGQLLKAIGRGVAGTVVSTVGPPFITLVLLVVLQIKEPRTAVIALVGSTVGSLVAAALMWLRATPRAGSQRLSTVSMPLLRTAWPLLVVGSLQLVIQWSDVMMVGSFEGAEATGIYTPALFVSALVGLILVALNSVAPPRFAVHFERSQTQSLEQVARDTSRLGALAAVPATLGLVILAPQIMQVFGAGFEGGASALRILVLGQFVNVSVGAVGLLLAMTGNERFLQRTMILAAALNIVLNAILIPLLGINGAAIATATSVSLLNLLNAAWVRNKLGIEPIAVLPPRHDIPTPSPTDRPPV